MTALKPYIQNKVPHTEIKPEYAKPNRGQINRSEASADRRDHHLSSGSTAFDHSTDTGRVEAALIEPTPVVPHNIRDPVTAQDEQKHLVGASSIRQEEIAGIMQSPLWNSSPQLSSEQRVNIPHSTEYPSEHRSPSISSPVGPHDFNRSNEGPPIADECVSNTLQFDTLAAVAVCQIHQEAYLDPTVAASSQGCALLPVFHRHGGEAMRGVEDPMISGETEPWDD